MQGNRWVKLVTSLTLGLAMSLTAAGLAASVGDSVDPDNLGPGPGGGSGPGAGSGPGGSQGRQQQERAVKAAPGYRRPLRDQPARHQEGQGAILQRLLGSGWRRQCRRQRWLRTLSH